MKYYYQNLEIRPGSTQGHSSKEKNMESILNPQYRSKLINLITPNQIRAQRPRPDRVRHFLRKGLLAALLCVASAVPVTGRTDPAAGDC